MNDKFTYKEGWIYFNDEYYCDFTLCNVMNLLNKENKEKEELKQQREELFLRERDTKNDWRELKEENEQLKQQLEDCEFAHRTEMAHHRVVEQELKEKIAKRDYTSQKLYDGDVE